MDCNQLHVDHSQLQTMTSDMVDLINIPLPITLHRAVQHELHLHGANDGSKSQDLLQPVGREHATFGMPGQRTAYVATQGILGLWGILLLRATYRLFYKTSWATNSAPRFFWEYRLRGKIGTSNWKGLNFAPTFLFSLFALFCCFFRIFFWFNLLLFWCQRTIKC